MVTAPRAGEFIGKFCLGGVEGLTGRGRLFLLATEESRLLGDMTSGDMATAGEKKGAGETAAAAPHEAGCSGIDTPKGGGVIKLEGFLSKTAGVGSVQR